MNKSNKHITFKGKELVVQGSEIKEGQHMPHFKLTGMDMNDLDSHSFVGKILIIASVPSLDTPVCSIETARFNKEASTLGKEVALLTVSMDLPFAQKRWCGAEGIEDITVASDYKYRDFADKFGVLIKEWWLLARAVFVIDRQGKVAHVEYVQEVSAEPDYEAVLGSVKNLMQQW